MNNSSVLLSISMLISGREEMRKSLDSLLYFKNAFPTEIILVDTNDDGHALELCTDVIYLLEPSVIKLNKMMMIHPDMLGKLKNEKVVLNQSLLTHRDVLDFERESGLKIYYNMPPLDERCSNSKDLDAFLMSLGFNRINASI